MTMVVTDAAPRARKPRVYQPFTMPHFRRWGADLVLDTGQTWRSQPFQEAFIADLFSGFPEAWLVVPEGNTKTTTLAIVALYHCENRPYASVPVAAASREQAEILYRQAEGLILRTERLNGRVHSAVAAAKGKQKTQVPRFVCLEGYRRINHHAGGRIQVFAADDRTGDGIIPTLGIIDEPHRLRDLALYRTWAGKIAKRQAQLVTISTSGEPGSDFEETRARIRVSATRSETRGSFTRYTTPRLVLHEWAVPDGDDVTDMAVVKAANPFKGITVGMLRKKYESPTMTMHHWLRFVCNRPTRDVDVWLGPDCEKIWSSLEDPYEFVPGAPTWVGVDAAITRDTTAVVALQVRPDGRVHGRAKFWQPARDEPTDISDVMHYVRTLGDTYKLQAVAFDPRFMDWPAKVLGDEGIPMVEISQGVDRMTPIIGDLYTLIREGGMTHDRDPMFSAHVLGAVARHNERGFTLKKAGSRGHIDGVIALALAADRWRVKKKERPALYLG
jgi:phage terminase large subunit-like protein